MRVHPSREEVAMRCTWACSMLSLILSLALAACGTPTDTGGGGSPGSGGGGGEADPTSNDGSLTHGGYEGYNVVLVSLDAVAAKHVGAYGYPKDTTPTLDALAADSFLFERCVASGPWTVPSTMSIFTGLWPSVHQVLNKYTVAGPATMVNTRLNPAIPTIPEHFGKNGYRLVAFTGDAGANGRFGYDKGFEVYLDEVKFGGLDYSVPPAQEWLRENAGSRFFMFLHGYDAHGQYDPPEGYRKVFVDEKYKGAMKGGKEEQGELRELGLANKYKPGSKGEAVLDLHPSDFEYHAALYDEKIQDADARLATFFETLKELGLDEKTIVVVTADHGEEFGEHGYLDHGPTLYDELIHVPLVIKVPGYQGARITEQVRNVDILPTVADLIGQELPFMTHGTSVMPLMRGEEQKLTAFAETDYRLFTHKRAVVDADGRYKFILTLENGRKELYDLVEDPDETQNLVETQGKIAYELEQELISWMLSMNSDPESFRNRKEEMIKEY